MPYDLPAIRSMAPESTRGAWSDQSSMISRPSIQSRTPSSEIISKVYMSEELDLINPLHRTEKKSAESALALGLFWFQLKLMPGSVRVRRKSRRSMPAKYSPVKPLLNARAGKL